MAGLPTVEEIPGLLKDKDAAEADRIIGVNRDGGAEQGAGGDDLGFDLFG